MSKINVSIIGASGYSGIELYQVLRRHPRVQVKHLFAQSSAGKRVDELYPSLRVRSARIFETYTPDRLDGTDAVFIALPSGEAMQLVPALLGHGLRVIDLGGDFRLQQTEVYKTYYKRDHTATDLLASAVYSLPEIHSRGLQDVRLLSNPGCYPTSAILPLAPLLKQGLIEPARITINSLSGVSGAGRSASVELSFAEVDGSVKPYRVGNHQHTPEIEAALSGHAGTDVRVTFTPHLLPITRGILTTTTASLVGHTDDATVTAAMEAAYGNAPFVRLLGARPPEIRSVVHTNYIDIGWHLYPRNGQIILLSAIDNLLKGAAGQAVQNFNRMFGIPETEGLL